jgi:hypothetical protein
MIGNKRRVESHQLARIRATILIAMSLLAGAFLGGCAWSVGSRDGETYVRPTQGQELIDLQRAHESGALSDAEYEAQRQKILTR